jgi:hypothetical protein
LSGCEGPSVFTSSSRADALAVQARLHRHQVDLGGLGVVPVGDEDADDTTADDRGRDPIAPGVFDVAANGLLDPEPVREKSEDALDVVGRALPDLYAHAVSVAAHQTPRRLHFADVGNSRACGTDRGSRQRRAAAPPRSVRVGASEPEGCPPGVDHSNGCRLLGRRTPQLISRSASWLGGSS